jgi:penicillin-binding protein 1A
VWSPSAIDDLPPWQKLLATVVAGGLVLGIFIAALIGSAGIIASAPEYKESIDKLRDLAQRSTVYDAQGKVLGVLGTTNREEVPLSQVPKVLREAVIAVEDKTFWTNSGVDWNAVARAFVKNITSGEIEQGGSTITQQLVKNRILSPKRDVNRKVREIVLAHRLTKRFTKRQILEQYLNTVYFGQGSYGVKVAVERFFLTLGPYGKVPSTDLQHVTLGQAALLAGLISNPEGDNPFRFPARAVARRQLVLQLMVKQEKITQEQADVASLEPIPTILPDAELRPRNAWVEEVQDRLFTDPMFKVLGSTVEQRKKRVLTGGLKINATMNESLQRIAQNSIRDQIPADRPGFTGALVAMDPKTGFVRAMVGGPQDFQNSQYNIATSYPGRQAGSTWKVITLAAALEAGFSPKDGVSGSSPCSFGYWGRTQNAERGGRRLTIRSATQGSVNCAFARIELAVGFFRVLDMAKKLGITQDTLRPILTLTLGTIESTALEMATVASTIDNGGVHHPPVFVSSIETADGQVLFDATKEVPATRAMSAEAAACEIDLLRGVISGGTGTAARLNGNRPVAGKTGTTDLKADANFLGFTPQLAVFIWHGYPLAQVPGAGFGGQVPARIFKEFMDTALTFSPPADFPPPGPVCDRPGVYVSEKGRGVEQPRSSRPSTTTPTSPAVVVTPPTAPATPPT